jgi:Holliday junction resolvase-like predicted endonuclease
MQTSDPEQLRVYETIMHKYLDGKPISSGTQKLSTVERDQAFFCHPLWDDVPREVIEHELFAVVYARYFSQETVSNTRLLQRAVTLAPHAVIRAIRYAQLFLKLESQRWQEVVQLESMGIAELKDFIKICEIINKEYRRLNKAVRRAEESVRPIGVLAFLLYASLHVFKYIIPKSLEIEQQYRDLQKKSHPTHNTLNANKAKGELFNREFALLMDALTEILARKLRASRARDLQISEETIAQMMQSHLRPFISPGQTIPRKNAGYLDAVSNLIQAHMDLRDFLVRSADSYSFDPDFNLVLSPCCRYAVLDPANAQEGTTSWEINGQKLEYLENYWYMRTLFYFMSSEISMRTFGSRENHEENKMAFIKALQAKNILTEVYGFSDDVTLESGTQVDVFKALLSGRLTSAFFVKDFIHPFGKFLQLTGDWHTAVGMLAIDGLRSLQNRFPLTWSERSEKARALIGWTVCEAYPSGDYRTSEAILEFWTLDLRAWADRLRTNSQAKLPELYEQPYLQIGEYLFQFPWLGAFRHTTNAAINNLRLSSKRRPRLRDETRTIEEHLGQVLQEHGFRVVMNYQPPRANNEDDAGEVDVICYRDRHLFVLEVKSTYVRRDFREAWQHKYQTLRRAGLQLEKKCKAVQEALCSENTLSHQLGIQPNEMPLALHGWIVDTSIEHDHEHFSGFLKVSLEEILIVLRNERYILLSMTELVNLTERRTEDDLYPEGFTAARFAAIIEGNELWSMLAAVPASNDETPPITG